MSEPTDVTNAAPPQAEKDTILRDVLPWVKRHIKDIIFVAVLIIVIAVLATTLISKLQIKHDVSGARAVTDRVIADVGKRDGAAVRKLGTKKFQSTYTDAALTAQFKGISSVTDGKPTIHGQTVFDGHDGKDTTAIISYKYPPRLANTPYYIGVVVVEKNGVWQVTNLSGSADTSTISQ